MKLQIFLFTFILAVSSSSHGFTADPEYQVPDSWFLHESTGISLLSRAAESDNPKLEKGIGNLLSVHKKLLDGSEVHSSADEKTKWHFTNYIFDLGVSLGGTMGLLMMKGTAAAQVIWSKIEAPPMLERSEGDFSNGSPLTIDDPYHIDGVVKTLMATGQVKDEGALRTNLKQTLASIQSLTSGIETLEYQEWGLSKIRFDLSVSASGQVAPFAAVGGGVKIRFDWIPKPQSQIHPFAITATQKKLNASMKEVIGVLARNLDHWSQSAPPSEGLILKSVRFGLGITAKFDIGVVKTSIAAFGYASFSRRTSFRAQRMVILSEDMPSQWTVLDSSLPRQADRWAQLTGMSTPHAVDAHMAGMLKTEKEGIVDGAQFEKGLSRATKLGLFISRQSGKVLNKSKWRLSMLKTNFELSLGGNLGIVGVNGSAGVELSFVPKS